MDNFSIIKSEKEQPLNELFDSFLNTAMSIYDEVNFKAVHEFYNISGDDKMLALNSLNQLCMYLNLCKKIISKYSFVINNEEKEKYQYFLKALNKDPKEYENKIHDIENELKESFDLAYQTCDYEGNEDLNNDFFFDDNLDKASSNSTAISDENMTKNEITDKTGVI